MSRKQRALIALLPLVTLMLLIGLMGASLPPVRSAAAPTPVGKLEEASATLAAPSPSATATPIPPTATLARRDFVDTASVTVKLAPTSFLPGRGVELPGELVASGRRLDFYVGQNSLSPEQVADMAVKAEYALGYLQKRFDTHLSERVSVGVYGVGLAPGRGTRGIAYTYGHTNVRIYYGPNEDAHKALVILTHELAHALQAEAYGREAQSRADIVLLEGLASFISGEYWLSLCDAESFQARAQELYHAGYNSDLAAMGRRNSDVAYDMWAGFVQYLAGTYGWDKFNLVYLSGRGRAAGSADYVGVYGKTFDELAEEWYASLE